MSKPQLQLLGTMIKGQSRTNIENVLGKLGLITIFDTPDDSFGRVLIKSAAHEKVYHANGIIFSRRSGAAICVPLRRLIKAHSSIINMSIGEINCAVNGTVVNIYFDNVMCISTSRGIDVSSLSLFGEKSYRDIFVELLNEAGLTTDVFDRTKTYTFVITHPDYHWLNVRGLTFIGAYDIVLGRHTSDDQSLSRLVHQKRGTKIDHTFYERMLYEADLSMLIFRDGVTEEDLACGSPPIFGFVIRSADVKQPDYYIESSLMKWFRQVIYCAYRRGIEHKHRFLYIKLSLYLSYTDIEIIGKVFASKIDLIVDFFAQMNDRVIPNFEVLMEEITRGIAKRNETATEWYSAATELVKRQAILGQNFKIRSFDNLDLIFTVMKIYD